MSTEKNPAMHDVITAPYGEEKQPPKKHYCSKAVIFGWIFVTFLLLLLIVLIVQFFFWPFDNRITTWAEKAFGMNPHSEFEIQSSIQQKMTILNPWELNFLVDPVNVCATRNPPDSKEYAKDPEVKLLILVPSTVEHFRQRQAIRNTWGSVAERRLGPMRLAFVVGTTPNNTLNDIVRGESVVHGDIIQADFPDDHHQRTTKGILMLKWVSMRCPHAQYFLKADDDTFVNLGNIAHILSCEPYLSEEKFIAGHVQSDVHPHRRTKVQKFHVSKGKFSAERYPPFASGFSYMMTSKTAVELFGASKRVKPLLPNEDVFLTGLCAQDIAAPLIHEPSFLVENPPSPPSWKTFSPLATAHGVTADIMNKVWKDMTHSVHDSLRLMEAAINSTVLLRRMKGL